VSINRNLVKCAGVGSLGGLLFGFDMAVIAGTTSGLTKAFALSPGGLGFTVSVALFGTILGAASGGLLESRFGARLVLRVFAVFYVISALGCLLASDLPFLLIARFLGGSAIGGSSVLCPVYIAELSPPRLRGRLVGLFQVNIVVGATVAYLSNYLISHAHLGALEWRVDFGVAAIPAFLFFVFLFTIPQSARWLAAKKRMAEAESVLQLTGSAHPKGELSQIVQAIEEDALGSSEALFQWKYRKLIFLAISLAALSQLSGINIVSYYLNDIFAAAGFNRFSSGLQAVFVGVVNVIATLVAMSVIDKFGRRFLLLVGSVGMAVTLVGVTAIFALKSHANWLLPFLAAYIGFFAASLGAVIWVYLSEIFPTRVRGKGEGLGASIMWIVNAAMCGTFPIVAKYSTALPFAFSAAMMIVLFFLVWIFFPETKNVSLEELQRKLGVSLYKEDSGRNEIRKSAATPTKCWQGGTEIQ
jgi:MFS transporter, SP family, arabinose:H+ symporter